MKISQFPFQKKMEIKVSIYRTLKKHFFFAVRRSKVAFEMQRKLVITPISKGLLKVTVNPVL